MAGPGVTFRVNSEWITHMGNRAAALFVVSVTLVGLSACGHPPVGAGARGPSPEHSPALPASRPTLRAFPKPSSDPSAPPCRDGLSAEHRQLSVAGIGAVVPMTGERGFYVAIQTNGRACNVRGVPSVTFWSGNEPAPVVLRLDGGPYQGPKAPPGYITLRPGFGPTAAFLVAKYRCDGGNLEPITEARVRLPGSAATFRLSLRGWGMDVCRPAVPGAPDPGNTVWIDAPDYASGYLGPLSDTPY